MPAGLTSIPTRFTGRIVHDLRRSGVRHLVRAGVPLHTVMAMSGHRTQSMLKRYDIVSLGDLRTAVEQAGEVVPLTKAGTEKTDRTPTVTVRG